MAQHSSKLMEAVTRLGESNNIRSECAMGRMELPREATVLEPVLPRYTPDQARTTADHTADVIAGVSTYSWKGADFGGTEERIKAWIADGQVVVANGEAPQEHIELATVIMQAWRQAPEEKFSILVPGTRKAYLAAAQRLCFLYHTVDGEVIAQDECLADELRKVFHAVFVGSQPHPWAELPRHSRERWLRALRAGRHWLANRPPLDLGVLAADVIGEVAPPKPGGVERVNLNNKAQDASDIVLEVAQVLRGNTGNPLTRNWEELAPELRAAWQKAAVYLYRLCAVYNPEDLPEWLLQDCCAAFMGHDNAWTDAHIPLWRSGVKAALRRLYKLRAQA